VVYLAVLLGGPDLDELGVHDRVHRALLPITGIGAAVKQRASAVLTGH
jgi:hypothetical protein